jgi:hypothetical protein
MNRLITFDESDKNLFQVDDARLRADALQHSILPRLHVVMNKCIATIREIYGIDALDDSIVSFYPHFREKREKDLEMMYEAAYAGLGGKRTKDKWIGVERKDKKLVQILPFRLGLQLTDEGMGMILENQWLKGLTDASFEKYFHFHLEHEAIIHSICYCCAMKPILWWDEEVPPISPLRQHYLSMIRDHNYKNRFESHWMKYPVSPDEVSSIVERFALFFPVYDAYLSISKGEPLRFSELLEKANTWCKHQADLEFENSGDMPTPGKVSDQEEERIKQVAEQKTRVMPAIRWQVFQRDNWRCVACGRGSHDGAILHVDHIVPRSKGGKDALENYQTLCDLCNIGKSNKDDTDLRKKDTP